METFTLSNKLQDYSDTLVEYGLNFTPCDFYWQVGELTMPQGWIIHLSVVKIQLIQLLETIIPTLIHEKITFKIARNSDIVSQLLDGSLGYINLGKIISIYPDNEEKALTLASSLITMTKIFRGPVIPTDRHLGSIVYTRYGSFKPILINSDSGDKVKYIYDGTGRLIQDPYHIPFRLDKGLTWPFGKIKNLEPSPKSKLLNNKYYLLDTLKADSKGFVIKALYFKGFAKIRSCLIKQGRKNMCLDEWGRDIKDRLKWQYDLYQSLHQDIPLPEIFDFFEEDEDSYLAMAFIQGKSVKEWLDTIYGEASWHTLTTNKKGEILDTLIRILKIIQQMHNKGFVHRDINSNNFIIDKVGKIWLIDLELSWSLKTGLPDPPFLYGTNGFMSPEQTYLQQPTIAQDIYAIGAFTLEFLTNFYPFKFDQNSVESLSQSLGFLIQDESIANYVASAMSPDPDFRPGLDEYIIRMSQFLVEIETAQTNKIRQQNDKLSNNEIKYLVQEGIDGLSSPSLSHEEYGWFSTKLNQEKYIGNAQRELGLYTGWHSGMCGSLWLISHAQNANLDITACRPIFDKSWEYVKKSLNEVSEQKSAGLFSGSAGIAMALVEGIKAGTFNDSLELRDLLQKCYRKPVSDIDISNGAAGVGISLVNAHPYLDGDIFETHVKSVTDQIISSQLKDGSWIGKIQNSRESIIHTGLDFGIAGIIWSELILFDKTQNQDLLRSLEKGIHWVKRQSIKKKSLQWKIANNSTLIDKLSRSYGSPGIALMFLKAFEVLKEPTYLTVAENILLSLPQHPMSMDFSFAYGLSGLGHVYLKAFRLTKNEIWKTRADWITLVIINFVKKNDEGYLYWIPRTSPHPNIGLFSGICGILTYLIDYTAIELTKYSRPPQV